MKRKLIEMILALVLSCSVLITSLYAWFTMNQTVTLDIKGVVNDNLNIVDYENSKAFYLELDETINEYSIGDEVSTSNCVIKKYDPIYDKTRKEEILFAIKLKHTTEVTQVNLVAKCDEEDYSASLDAEYIESTLSLSNVINLTEASVINDNVNVNGTSMNFLNMSSDGDVLSKNTSITLLDAEPSDYVYFIIDFNDDALEEIYSKNLGYEMLNGELKFTQDLDFYFVEA